MAPLRTLVVAALSSLAVPGDAASFLQSGQVSEGDASGALDAELAAAAAGRGRTAGLEEALRATYASLPKNAAGHLGHQAVRYVLHRLFVQRSGWFIRGLEPNNETWHDVSAPHGLQEWVPSYLQGLLEQRLGERGTDLHELAALAAALEDLIAQEAVGRLEAAYQLHELPRTGTLSAAEVEEVVSTYYITFLLAGNFSAVGKEEAGQKKSFFTAKYAGWKEAEAWLRETIEPHTSAAAGGRMDFARVAAMVDQIGQRYYRFNDVECKSLKSTLRGMEGNKAGRVRLSNFYKKALYSHWRFTEKADYLRVLGALDESDPQSPQVIASNYVMARPNCLEASNLYAICCRNECEDLMGHLEAEIGASTADPKRISELVAALPSDTVSAPRNLSAALLGRLDQVAATHGGRVPLHGRLFAQWMHHAYPRECPYPHEAGTTSPQTPDEWMAQTGQGDSQASEAEMVRAVEADTCTSSDGQPPTPGDCGEGSELPWDENEELLVAHPRAFVAAQPNAAAAAAAAAPAATTSVPVAAPGAWSDFGLALAIAGGLGVVLAADYVRSLRRRGIGGGVKLKNEDLGTGACAAECGGVGWRAVLGFTAVTCLARACDLLDGVAFGCALCGGLALIAARRAADRLLDAAAPAQGELPSKCCV